MNYFKRKLGITSHAKQQAECANRGSKEWIKGVENGLSTAPPTPNTDNFIEDFMAYIADWRELDRQYSRIASWRHIKQLRNIKKRETLTRRYIARCKKRGIII